jgi:hypothetical protein
MFQGAVPVPEGESMTNEERADEWFADNHFDFDDLNESEYALLCKRLAQALAEAEERGRRKALEEAAKAIAFDALEMTAFMGLPEHKRLKYVRALQDGILLLADTRKVPHE